MIKFFPNLALFVAHNVNTVQGSVQITGTDAAKLNSLLQVGDSIYLTACQYGVSEVMRYDHTAPLDTSGFVTLPVHRDAEGTGAKNFSSTFYLRGELSNITLLALICQQIGNC
jgi:hypothetical protein